MCERGREKQRERDDIRKENEKKRNITFTEKLICGRKW